jgi:ADP-heptose:LPS heptosyltransferase
MHNPLRILIIKQGALGDIVLATAAFKAIRKHYPDAHISCLTRPEYVGLLGQCAWFDNIITDTKPKFWQIGKMRALSAQLNAPHFDWVIDLQNATRSSIYWWLFGWPKPKFSGVCRFASHRFTLRNRKSYHAYKALGIQLETLGIHDMGLPDMRWLSADISQFSLPDKYILMMPGGAPHRPEKRWQAKHFAALSNMLHTQLNLKTVLIGTQAEATEIAEIQDQAPHAISLMGKTSIADLVSLAQGATGMVGNDTGPIHIAAASSNAAALALFSHVSSPEKSAPIGAHVATLQSDDLASLSPEIVFNRLSSHLTAHPPEYIAANTAKTQSNA